jgi:hypothetical protein
MKRNRNYHFLPELNKGFIIIMYCMIISMSQTIGQNYVTTYAGTGNPGYINGDTSEASFNKPFGICIDTEGNLFIADAYNHVIRKIGVNGQVSTYAGSGIAGYLDGEASQAKFNQPINICFDPEGNMYVSDFLNQRIRKISIDGIVTTIAGTGQAGLLDGPALEAKFNYPRGICLDDTDNIYIGDSWNHRIRKISTDGFVSTWAGGGTSIGVQSVGDYLDGSDTSARFYTPCELSIDNENNIYVADAYNHRIRMIDPERIVSTVAGTGDSGPDSGGFLNGPALESRFNTPTAVFIANDGNIYVGDGINQRVRKISNDLMVSTFAGSGDTGFENGTDTLSTFNFPRGCTMDYNLNRLYVVDYNNHAIRIIHLTTSTGSKETPEYLNGCHIYPNPSAGEIKLFFNSELCDLYIQICDNSGREVMNGNFNNRNELIINLTNYNPGCYCLHVFSGNRFVASNKFIINGK